MPIYTNTKNITNTKSGTPTITFNSKINGISSCSIYGNGQQIGVPSPDNIIIPNFCGMRTGNLFDMSDFQLLQVTSTAYRYGTNVGVLPQGSYTFSATKLAGAQSIYLTSKLNNTYSQTTISSVPFTFSADGESEYIIRTASNTGTTWEAEKYSDMMLNAGATALPYEPYGYKIPITCAGQTVPVYLGQTQTVRRIKKLVLNGTEIITKAASNPVFTMQFGGSNTPISENAVTTLSTHYQAQSNTSGTGSVGDARVCIRRGYSTMYIGDTRYDNAADYKSYLAAQYAAGTPVTIWYVLAKPETGIVNEPLAKIGDYADELTFTNSQIQIPTIEGINTLSVDTTLPPSNIEINYTLPDYSKITKIYKQDGLEIKHILDNNGKYIYKAPAYYTWEGIRNIVRSGKAPQYYPIGSIIYDNFNSDTGTAFQVIAYDKHFDPSLTSQGYTHSMTLCELMLTDVITFDAAEAFLYVETEIPAGVYKFTIPNYDAPYGGNKTYYFTSTKSIPVGGQLVLTWQYNQLPNHVASYSNNTTTTAIESNMPLTEWIEGTSPEAINLGTIAGPTTQLGSSNYGKMNHIHRARYGSNNYLQSGVRQYINSNSAANTWWTPQTIFDRPYGSIALAGKLTKLNQDLVSVMATPEIKSKTNQYFETDSLDGTSFTLNTDYTINEDKMFLLSPMEVNFNTVDTSIGVILDYYVLADNNKRLKYRKSNNTAYYWWLRTPYPTNARTVRLVLSSGALSDSRADSSIGVAPACVIQ